MFCLIYNQVYQSKTNLNLYPTNLTKRVTEKPNIYNFSPNLSTFIRYKNIEKT